MPVTDKILGQVAGTNSISSYNALYVVPASTNTVSSTIAICNTAATAATYRIGLTASANSSPALQEHIVYGASVPANDTVFLTLGVTMEAGKEILVASSASTVVFSVFGSEKTP